ncbi:MAG: hypothetical protein ACYTKD_17645 [Planctomycetota bacterium]|jgi:hypothetical protein
MRSRLAFTAVIGAAVAGCAGSASTWRPADARPAPAVVQRLLRGITDDISAISHRYPELSRWHLRHVHRMGFVYEFQCKAVRPRIGKPYTRFGRRGCWLTANVFRPEPDPGPRQMTTTRKSCGLVSICKPIPDLGLVVHAYLRTGDAPSDGLVEEIRRIFTERIGALQEKREDPSSAARTESAASVPTQTSCSGSSKSSFTRER